MTKPPAKLHAARDDAGARLRAQRRGRSPRYDPISTVEACYREAEDDGAWLRGILGSITPLRGAFPAWAATFDLRDPTRFRFGAVVTEGPIDGSFTKGLRLWETLPAEYVHAFWSTVPLVETQSRRLRAFPCPSPDQREFLSRIPGEAVSVVVRDLGGRGVQVGYLAPPGHSPAPRTVHGLTLVTAHVASALRLRALARPAPGSPNGADAVLDPSGTVHDARGTARPREARRSLAEAVQRVERARGSLRAVDSEEALQLWKGLVVGEWSLVDRYETDGRRFVLARRNRPDVPDVKALRRREREVLAYAVRGHSNKYIAYLLGISTTTVAAHLASARARLGARSRRELIQMFGWCGADGATPADGARTDALGEEP